jgi:F-type H+-transporting ATPase subunit a
MPNITLAAEKIGGLWGFPISNSLLATWLVMLVLSVFAWSVSRSMTRVPSTLQSIAEILIGGLYDFFHQITGSHIAQFFPLIASLFIFIITANWMGLLPGFSTIGIYHTPVHAEEHIEAEHVLEEPILELKHELAPAAEIPEIELENEALEEEEEVEFIPILRASTADLNTTVGLALIAVIAIQYFGFSVVGFQYITKFINFKDPIMFVLGILETISEISRIISFAFRLFGNIFAGEVLLAVLAFLMPFIVPLPFLMMELFVGFIQALVFSMLTAVFLNVAVSHASH